jgi:hypothetical protein
MSPMTMRFLIPATMAALQLAASAAAPPAWKADLTPAASGPHPRLAPSSLLYDLSWKGRLNAGEIRMEFAPPDAAKRGTYVVRCSAFGKGAASVLFSSRFQFWSELNPSNLRPRFFQGIETDSKETVTTTVQYHADRVESRETTRTLRGGNTSTRELLFEFSPVHDLFSAMLHVRSQKLDPGEQVTIVVQPFETPYLLRVRCIGREVHAGVPAIRLTVGMQKIDRDTLELKPYKKLKSAATLWLSDDHERVPLELRAAAFIGDVRVVIRNHRKL